MSHLKLFVKKYGIVQEFSSPRTPQKNGDVERKNRSLKEMARTMIHENNMAKHFWAEVVNTSCYIQNRIYIRPILHKITYEFFKGRKPNISYFHQFGCTCYILNNKVYLKKFDAKAQREIFLYYSERSKAYKVYNSETQCVEESMHIKFDDKEPVSKIPKLVESFADIQVFEESDDSPRAEPTPDAHNEEAFHEAQDGSQQATQWKNIYKYKSSHLETKKVPKKQDHISNKNSLCWDCYQR